MPDWSYHVVFEPLLSRLSPFHSREFIHKGLNRIASLPGGSYIINFFGREETSHLLEKEIEQMRFSNSIGLSGKIDPLLSGTKAFSNLGFGFIEVGPVTKEPGQNGEPPSINRKEKFIEFPASFESIGLQETVEKLKEFTPKQPVFIRLVGNIVEQLEIMKSLELYANAFIVDDPLIADAINSQLDFKLNHPIYIAIPANEIFGLPLEKVQQTFSGIVLDEQRYQKDDTNLLDHFKAIKYLKEHDWNKTIITVGGVREPEDALQLFEAKVDFIMLSGGYVFSGPGLPKRIKEAQLEQFPENDNPHKGWVWYFLFGFSILIGGLMTLLISMTDVILPYDEHFLEMERQVINTFNERIPYFMAHDRMTLAGTMTSGGLVYMMLARYEYV